LSFITHAIFIYPSLKNTDQTIDQNIEKGKELTTEIDLNDFRQWVSGKYSHTYTILVLCYVSRYHHLLYGNLRELDSLSDGVKANTVKALIVLSKYLGKYKEFKERLSNYGVKITVQDSFGSFLRILKASDSDILQWFKNTKTILRDNEQLLLKYTLLTGLRKEEAIMSFNMIIKLSKEKKISEYYDSNLNCLCHFKYPKLFLRRTKNTFISFVTPELLRQIANSEPLTYHMINKKLFRRHIRTRINELRDYYATFMLSHGILEHEVNLTQGRVKTILFQHYWSPKLSELRDRIFKATSELEQQT